MAPPLGWIEPIARTPDQQSAHFAAVSSNAFVRHTLQPKQMAKGQAVRLFDLWSHPDVVADVGFSFTRWHQITGSCVKAGAFNAVISTICAQRVASDNPTKAFMPFLWHNYAMSRHYYGADGEGEGSMGSTMQKSLTVDGVRDYPVDRSDILPDYTYDIDNGFQITRTQELDWSSYRNPSVAKVLQVSKAHLFGISTEAKTPEDILALVQNGYGVSFACNNYIGSAQIRGSGANARVMGRWDSRGGHQQSILGVEEHPDFGTIYWAQNNWPADTYPRDPAGGPVCGCWVTESDVKAAMRLDAEVYGFGSLDWFPAQPKLLEWDM